MKSVIFFAITFLLSFPIFSQTVIFEDNFEGLTFGSQWTATSGIPNGIVDVASAVGFDGTRGVRIGKTSSAGGFVTNTLDLKLDLSGQNQVALTFKIHDRNDETQAEDGLYLSDNNGGIFKKVLAFLPSDWCNQYGEFPPIDIDALAALHGLSLTSQFIIRFQHHGDNTLPNNDGIYIDDVKVYVPVLTYASLPFSDDFEVPTFGSAWSWSFADQTNTLAAIPTRPSNIVDIASGIGFNNSRGVRMGKACADGFATNALDLHLNLAGQTQVAMTFKIHDRNDETQADDGIYFSDNGGETFEKVLAFLPSEWCNQYGEFPPIDIDALAALNGLSLTSQFIIRFQHHGDNTLPNNDGIYIDDVKVYVPVLTYASLPFNDDFEVPTFGSAWSWSFANQTNTLAEIPTRPSNIVDIASGIGFNNSRGVRMGKACADGFATNALDLHLNLAGQTQVAMTFKIHDRNDETQADDGIYFSDNGGETFEKVLAFLPSDWCNQYGEFPPIDIDALAALHDLSLTSQFIIRFQHHGDNTLPNNDGIYIDDVKVYVPVLTYASLPFNDDFEVPTFGSAWSWSFANQTNTLAEIPTRPSNIVDIASGIGFNNSRGVRMGKACADGFATNALDLHLNLAGQTQVAMTFKIHDRNDETQADDGIYFSADGGSTFKKVFGFDFSNTANVYTDYTIDIESLATSNNVSLTSQFIVRFQQHGDNTLPNNDGIYLDNVNITGVTASTNEEKIEAAISIYPNPAHKNLNLVILDNFSPNEYRYNIKNQLGEIILSGQMKDSNEIIDVAKFTPGLYIIEVQGKKGSTSRQFVKI